MVRQAKLAAPALEARKQRADEIAQRVRVTTVDQLLQMQVNFAGIVSVDKISSLKAKISARREVLGVSDGRESGWIVIRYQIGRLTGDKRQTALQKLAAGIAHDVAWIAAGV